jgi:hypothetical protein
MTRCGWPSRISLLSAARRPWARPWWAPTALIGHAMLPPIARQLSRRTPKPCMACPRSRCSTRPAARRLWWPRVLCRWLSRGARPPPSHGSSAWPWMFRSSPTSTARPARSSDRPTVAPCWRKRASRSCLPGPLWPVSRPSPLWPVSRPSHLLPAGATAVTVTEVVSQRTTENVGRVDLRIAEMPVRCGGEEASEQLPMSGAPQPLRVKMSPPRSGRSPWPVSRGPSLWALGRPCPPWQCHRPARAGLPGLSPVARLFGLWADRARPGMERGGSVGRPATAGRGGRADACRRFRADRRGCEQPRRPRDLVVPVAVSQPE